MSYLIFSICAALSFALTFFLRKLAGKETSLTTAYFIETCIQMLIMIIIFFLISPDIRKGFDFKSKGIPFAALAGLTIVIGVFANYFALKTGIFSKVVAITSPAQIIFGLLLGILLAGDSITLKQIIGVVISLMGMYLIVIK